MAPRGEHVDSKNEADKRAIINFYWIDEVWRFFRPVWRLFCFLLTSLIFVMSKLCCSLPAFAASRCCSSKKKSTWDLFQSEKLNIDKERLDLLRQIYINQEADAPSSDFVLHQFVWFNAWLYSGSDNIWAGLVVKLHEAVEMHFGPSYSLTEFRAKLIKYVLELFLLGLVVAGIVWGATFNFSGSPSSAKVKRILVAIASVIVPGVSLYKAIVDKGGLCPGGFCFWGEEPLV